MSFNEFSSDEPKRHIPTDAIIVLGATLSVFLLGGILHLLSGGVRAQEDPAPMTRTEDSVLVDGATPRPETETQVETRVDETRIITQPPALTPQQPRAEETPPAGMNDQPFVGSPPPVVQQPPVTTEQPAVPPTTPAPLEEAPVVAPSPAPPMDETPAPTMGEPPAVAPYQDPMMGEAPAPTMGEEPGMTGEAPGMTGEMPGMMGETPVPQAQPQAITDPALIETLNQSLYNQIDQNWRTVPTFTEDLAYRVQINEQGEIVSYQPMDPVGQEYTEELPLSDLRETPAAENATAQPLANFRVVFTPTGELQVNPWQNDIPQ